LIHAIPVGLRSHRYQQLTGRNKDALDVPDSTERTVELFLFLMRSEAG
jgi:hypothetical protein